MKPNTTTLANWLLTWVNDNGAIHGFHNHSVWGSNPYRWSDFTSGHSTWASPLLTSLALVIKEKRDPKLEELLVRLIRFQTTAFQEDGQYAHIGFQIGESLKRGLIHNMLPNVALGLTAEYAKSWLPAEHVEAIRTAIANSMETNDVMYPFGALYKDGKAKAISNQEYARLWGKLQYQHVFGEVRWDDLPDQLDFMIERYHVKGFPDEDSDASYRYLGDMTNTEPAEYYGLLIAPLILAYEMYGTERYLEAAGRLCRHLARCAWYDDKGQIRLHRAWYYSGSRWVKIKEPMLIAGMGMSLYGIQKYLSHRKDDELERFLSACDRTYATYQNPRGFFASATGWQGEGDIAPCSAWHSHDLLYLLVRHGMEPGIHEELFKTDDKISVLLGDQCIWMEKGNHWTITDYAAHDVFKLLGRKDENYFGRDMDWIGGDRTLPDHFSFKDQPVFMRTDEGVFLKPGPHGEEELNLSWIGPRPYLGAWR